MKQAPKVSKKATQLLNEFDVAAYNWGWQKDQGYGSALEESEIDEIAYKDAKAALFSFISKLELQNSKIKKQSKDASRLKMGD